MAYKFQIGAAILSGSIKAEDGLVGTDVDGTTADFVIAALGDKEIPHTKVALESGDILIGDGSGVAQNQTISGDATIAAGGALTIANNAISLAKMAGLTRGSIIHGDSSGDPAALAKGNANTVLSSDGTDVSYTAVSNAMLAGSIANGKLSNSTISGKALGTNLDALAVDDSSIEYSAGSAFNGSAASTIRVKAAGIVNSMLADDAVGADELAANAVVDASVASNAAISLSKINTNVDMGGHFSIGNQSSDRATFAGGVIIGGDLTVQGTTTTVDSTTINVSSSFTFEGVADDFETTLTLVDPAADRTVMLPNASGVLAIFDPSLSDSELATALTAAPSELNLLDAIARGSILHGNSSGASALLAKGNANTVLSSDGTDISYSAVSNAMLAGSIADSKLNQITTAGKVALSAIELDGGTDIGAALVDADLFMVDDGAGGTMRKSAMSRLKTYIGNGTSAVASFGDADATLIVGINFASANTSAARTLTLPASPSVGESVKVKVAGVSGGVVTIARAGSQTIDGSLTAIVLESDSAAVELVYVASNDWRVF